MTALRDPNIRQHGRPAPASCLRLDMHRFAAVQRHCQIRFHRAFSSLPAVGRHPAGQIYRRQERSRLPGAAQQGAGRLPRGRSAP